MAAKDTQANSLRYGDYVYLSSLIPGAGSAGLMKEAGFLYADGMCLGRTGVQISKSKGEFESYGAFPQVCALSYRSVSPMSNLQHGISHQ